MNKIKYSIVLTSLLISSCDSAKKLESKLVKKDKLSYASGFTIHSEDSYTLITINMPYKNAQKKLRYVVYPANNKKPQIEADAFIQTPITTIVCTSTSHIPLLDYLGETNTLVGFPTTDYISSKKMRNRIDSGFVSELGIDNALNIEKIINLNPSLVMAYTLNNDFGQFKKIKEAGIPVLINAEYMELDPLGRAEWIKLLGLLFDKKEKADSVFKEIELSYIATKKKVDTIKNPPSVMTGSMYGNSWYLPGGKSYAARLFTDAGFKYIWNKDTTTGFLSMSYEVVLDKANNANYWVGASNYTSLKEMKEANINYSFFKPFKTKKIYSYNKQKGDKGGSEFLELGYLRPDLILKDLVKIAHPTLLPNHELFFYFPLESE